MTDCPAAGKKLLTAIKREYSSLPRKLQKEISELFEKALLNLWGGESRNHDEFSKLVSKVCMWISLEKPRLMKLNQRTEAVRRLEAYAESLLPSHMQTRDSNLQGSQLFSHPVELLSRHSVTPADENSVDVGDMNWRTVGASCDMGTNEFGFRATKAGGVLPFGIRVTGFIKRFKDKDIIVVVTDGDSSVDKQIEIVIPKKALFSGGVRLNPGDIVSFKRSEKDPLTGYAPELIRIQVMDIDQIERYIKRIRDHAAENAHGAISFITRCLPPWQYICSRPQLTTWMTSDILGLVSQLVSSSNCLGSDARLGRILKSLANSRFTATVLHQYVKREVHSYFSPEASIVQTVVEALIQTVPDRCTRLLPVIEYLSRLAHDEARESYAPCLASSQEEGCDTQSDGHDSWKSVEFLLRVTRTLAVSVSGAAEDVTSLNWNELPLVPARSELLGQSQVEDVDVPIVLVDQPYESEDAYLDTYFRLLREDCFHELRVNVQKFVKGELDHRDMAVYRIHLDGVQIDNNGMALSIRFKPLSRRDINWNYSRLLMFGNLVCLSMNANFDEPIWAMVAHRTPELLEKGIVFLTLSSEHNRLSDAEIVLLLKSCAPVSAMPHKARRIAVMAESPSYYRAYGPVLLSLKNKINGIAFKEELVDISSTHKPPEYLEKDHVDWSCIFDGETAVLKETSVSSSVSVQDCASLVDKFDKLVHNQVPTTLDETQLSAIRAALQTRVTLIQGPPGTGKSYIGVKLVELILSTEPESPILVVTYKNHALDQFLVSCLEFCEDIIRIGGRSQNETLMKYNLKELRQGARADRDTRGTKRQLADLRKQFPTALRSLKNSHIFSVDRFIQSASLEQIQSLCKDCPQGIINSSSMPFVHGTLKLIDKALACEDSSEQNHKLPLLRSHEVQAAVSCLLLEWTPDDSTILSVGQREKVPIHLLNDLTSCTPLRRSGDNENMDDEDDSEELIEQRLLSHDTTKPDRWRDPGQGFIRIDDAKSSDMPFACVLPHVVGDIDGHEVSGAGNLWYLSPQERARLILHWMKQFAEGAHKDVVEVLSSYAELSRQLKEQTAEDDAKLISEASIIGMTTTGAAINAALINLIAPKIILVEEAAEILESQLVAVLPSSAQHLIMIGDHKQLRPQVQCDALRRYHRMDVSMFERLIKHLPATQLGYQCRMREEFVELIRPIYPNLKTHKKLVVGNLACRCIEKTMFFWNHSFPEQPSQFSRSWCNIPELDQVLKVLDWLIRCGYEAEKITILTSYRGQLQEIKAQLQKRQIFDVVTSTIDRYQGDENDFLLVSLVRSRRMGFLSAANRMCVAASRARCGVYFFGDANLLKTSPNSCWTPLIEHLESLGCVDVAFPFVCPVHSSRPVMTNTGMVPVCLTVCSVTLPCGHACKDSCHLLQPHPKCKEVVEFNFPKCGHPSQRPCHRPQKEFYCKEKVHHPHPNCGHIISHPCWQEVQSLHCRHPCERLRPQCGHPCSLLCHEKCVSQEICHVCEEIDEEIRKKQARANLKVAEARRQALQKDVEELRRQPPETTCLQSVSRSPENNDLFLDVQNQVSRFLPADDGMEVSVDSLERIVNKRLCERWMETRTKQRELTDPVYRFVVVSLEDLEGVIDKGLSALEVLSFYQKHPDPLASLLACEGNYRLVRFGVLKGRLGELEKESKAEMKKRELDSGLVCDKGGRKRLVLRSANQALPDYVVTFSIVPSDLGMTFQSDYFDVKSLRPSRDLASSRLDDLLFREAESQFYRMCGGTGRFRVVQVDVVNNGNLNIRYRKTKERFRTEKKPLLERFVFHGTKSDAVDSIIREGFKIGGKDVAVEHGTAYGKGVYTAEDPSTAMSYTSSGRVLLSRIIPGQKDVDYNLGGSEHVFVLKASEQLLPQYVVHYELKINY